MVLELHYTAPQSVTDALASLGRTEDVRPSNRRLAVASFHRNPSHEVLPIAQWPADRTTLLNAPGSVAVTRVEERGPAAETPRHPGWSEREPGTTVDCRQQPHHAHVLLYENSPALNADADPDGILRGIYYPHGLRFSADGRHLFVADAGAPYLHIYAQDPDQWSGVRHPVASIRIMEDAVFERGRRNPEEGGPKGLDIDAGSKVLVVTSECQPLAFFDMPALLQIALAGGSAREQSILGISHELSLMQESRKMAEQATDGNALRNSLSWRITAPLRRLNAAFRRHASLASHGPGQGEEHGKDTHR